jgi:preprotein translocase subunit SecG
LTRATAILAILFFLTSLTLAWYAMQTTDRPGLMEQAVETDVVEEEVAPAPESEVPEVIMDEQQGSGSEEEVPTIPE